MCHHASGTINWNISDTKTIPVFTIFNVHNLTQRLPLHVPLFKAEKFIAVVVVLFVACGKLGGKLGGKGGKCVQNSDDFLWDLQRLFWVFRAWDWDWKLLQHRLSNRYRGSPNAFHQD